MCNRAKRCSSLIAVISLLLALLTADYFIAQRALAQPPPSSSPIVSPTTDVTPSPPFTEDRMGKLEAQIKEIEKKIVQRPKDGWDIATTISGILSTFLIAGLGLGISWYFKRRDTALQEAQKAREEQDRKAQYGLEKLRNDQTQRNEQVRIEIEKLRTEREAAVSLAQTVRALLPDLRSTDPKDQVAALTLITVLGNPDVAVKISNLYKDDSYLSLLRDIIATPGSSLERRRQAAVALGRFGKIDEAVLKLLELSREPKAETGERFTIAEELDKMLAEEQASQVRLELALDPKVPDQERRAAGKALKQAKAIDEMRQKLRQIARDQKEDVNKRIIAIRALGELSGWQDIAREWAPILLSIVRVRGQLQGSADIQAACETLKEMGRGADAAQALFSIASLHGVNIANRFAAIEHIKRARLDYPEGAEAKRVEILKELAHATQEKVVLRLLAVEELIACGEKEEAARATREILAGTEATGHEQILAIKALEKMGHTDEARDEAIKRGKELTRSLSPKFWKWVSKWSG